MTTTLTKAEAKKIEDYIWEKLPLLLRENPKVAVTIEGMLAKQFPRRDELTQLLDKMDRRIDLAERRFELQTEEMDRRFEKQTEEMNRRFEQQTEEMNRRFEQQTEEMDRRFEQQTEEMNRRFEQQTEEMNRRFEAIDRRFEQVDERFEAVDRRFEQVDRRFEQVDRRFEQVDERFEQVDERFEEARQERLLMRRDIHKLQAGQDNIIKRLDGQESWMKFNVGDLRNEKGKRAEDMVAAALQYGLKNPDISPDKIRLRQKLVDTEGQVFKKGYETEVDLIAENGLLTVFEVKYTVRPGDVDMFAWKVELLGLQNSDKEVKGILISWGAGEEVRERCEQYGVTLLD
ncbi:MAG: hypothetical protein B6243_10765 [Anaerolineaceae bacterium 4572_5.2]|nr:MAG: hypothetical protein B6243_10765 [Anaerolineaceae bacterium 4572_5.2]